MSKLSRIIQRNNEWVFSKHVNLNHKFKFYISLPSLLFFNKKVNYLGNSFFYDNPILPFSLMAYPKEIKETIVDLIDSNKIKTVLDIGGNLGQFSITINYFLKSVKIDILEPNKQAFDLLEKNIAKYSNLKAFNVGIGKEGKTKMYFTPGKSAIGSLNKANAVNNIKDKIVETEISLVEDVSKYTKTKKYDLVKIDVEGYEYDLLKNIILDTPKYLYIELSGPAREHDYSIPNIYDLIEKKFGEFEIVYSDQVSKEVNGFNQLLKFC